MTSYATKYNMSSAIQEYYIELTKLWLDLSLSLSHGLQSYSILMWWVECVFLSSHASITCRQHAVSTSHMPRSGSAQVQTDAQCVISGIMNASWALVVSSVSSYLLSCMVQQKLYHLGFFQILYCLVRSIWPRCVEWDRTDLEFVLLY